MGRQEAENPGNLVGQLVPTEVGRGREGGKEGGGHGNTSLKALSRVNDLPPPCRDTQLTTA